MEEYYNLLELYDAEYTKKLIRIAEYYELLDGKEKSELIDDIVNCEMDVINKEIVEKERIMELY